MTQQEFVKKESERIYTKDKWSVSILDESHSNICEIEKDFISIGLTKGLEIAEGFSEWKENNYIKVWNKYCHRHGVLEDIGSHKTTSQLLEIYLTEYKK